MPDRRTDLPHVTDILADVGLIDSSWFTDEARDRGTAVHKALEYLDQGDLNLSSVEDPVARVRIRGYQKFLAEVDVEILGVEVALEHPTYRYCGTADRVVRIGKLRGVLDIKPPTSAPWHGVQLAAYLEATMAQEEGVSCSYRREHSGRWTLHLGDGSYGLRRHAGRKDWQVFVSALTLYNWKRQK